VVAGENVEDFGGNADLMQAERQRQSADAAAGDKNGHDSLYARASWQGVMAWEAPGGNCERPPANASLRGAVCAIGEAGPRALTYVGSN
jgi:hypothetical protein